MDTDDEEDEVDVAALRNERGDGGTPGTRVPVAATVKNQVPRERTSQGVFSMNGACGDMQSLENLCSYETHCPRNVCPDCVL